MSTVESSAMANNTQTGLAPPLPLTRSCLSSRREDTTRPLQQMHLVQLLTCLQSGQTTRGSLTHRCSVPVSDFFRVANGWSCRRFGLETKTVWRFLFSLSLGVQSAIREKSMAAWVPNMNSTDRFSKEFTHELKCWLWNLLHKPTDGLFSHLPPVVCLPWLTERLLMWKVNWDGKWPL